MQLATHPLIAAGFALVGASIIAVTPVAPPLPDLEVPAVRLTAGEDPITAWEDVFNTAFGDVQALAQDWLAAPFPVLQQVIGQIVGLISDDLQPVAAAALGADFANLDTAHLPALQGDVGGVIIPTPLLSPEFMAYPFTPITFATEALLGAMGPVVSPILALGNGIQEIAADLTGTSPDLTAALDDLINIPTAVTGAFLNGYGDIDLTQLIPLLSELGLSSYLPGGSTLDSLDVAMGGLLSPGESPFNALGFSLTFDPPLSGGPSDGVVELAAGSGVGPFGALVDLSQAVAPALQQVIGNLLPDFQAIAGHISDDLQAAANAPFEADFADLDATHTAALNGDFVDAVIPSSRLDPEFLHSLDSPITSLGGGVLIGALGPVVSPILALTNSVQEIVTELFGANPDLTAALDDLINIPAAVTGAFLNGYGDIDLTPLLPLLSEFVPLSDFMPATSTIDSLDITMGGLLSPGGPLYNAFGFDDTLTNSVTDPVTGLPTFDVDLAGSPVGTIGSLVDLSQAIAEAIGWSGTGDPLSDILSSLF